MTNIPKHQKTVRRFLVCAIMLIILIALFVRKSNMFSGRMEKEVTSSETTGSPKIQTWGPERALYTWNTRADFATIDAITDNPAIGDERNFVRIRKAGTDDKFVDNVIAEVGAEYEVQVYVHNNADSTKDDGTGNTYAQNIRIKMAQIVENVKKGENVQIKGIITATNTTPKEVWDTAYIKAEEPVSLRYVPDSCRLHTAGSLNDKLISDEALFGKGKSIKGTRIGYDRWGLLPGGEQYACNITFRFKVDKSGLDMSCMVSKENANDYHYDIDAAPGEILDFKIRFKNTGTTLWKNVVAYVKLGEGIEYVPGTTRIFNDFFPKGTLEKDNLFQNGFNIGDYKAGQEAIILYKVRVLDDENLFPCGHMITVENDSAAGVDGATIHDKVQIRVYRNCNTVTEETSK